VTVALTLPTLAAGQGNSALAGSWTLDERAGGGSIRGIPIAIMEYACHEGNRAMANILSAARAEERAGRPTEFPTAAEGER
jgi:hypothetical protein